MFPDPPRGPSKCAWPSKLSRHLWRFEVAGLTIWAAVWLATLGPFPAIFGMLAAKHLLVALLLAYPPQPDGGEE